jgi:hypothetical protein
VIEQNIIQNLYATARRIEQTNLFEQAVAKAFRYLGFDIQELGKHGETDLLALVFSDNKTLKRTLQE